MSITSDVGGGIGAGEGPVVAVDGDEAQRRLGGVVGHAKAAIVEEADQALPAVPTENVWPAPSRRQALHFSSNTANRSRRRPVTTCAYQILHPAIFMMKPAKNRPSGDLAER